MSGVPAGSIIHVGGRTVLNRLQDAGLQDPRVPTETIYETGNNLVVGKVLTEADFRFQLTSWDVSCDLMALLTGEFTTLGDQISGGDAAGTIYRWENCAFVNIMSPWKRDTGSQGGHIVAGVLIPNLYPTALSYRLGVTENAQMQVTMNTGSYFMAEGYPVEEHAAGDGTAVAFVTSENAMVYRVGGAGSTVYQHVWGVMVNGVPQTPNIDYVESGGAAPDVAATAVTITFAVAPPAGADVKYAYFSDTAHAIPQADNFPTGATAPAAVRGRDITILIGNPWSSPLTLNGVQSFELQASVSGALQRQMGTQDPIGFANTAIDTNGTVQIEPKDIPALFTGLSNMLGIDADEVFGYINQHPVPLTAVIHEPGTSNIIKSIYIKEATFQAPGENVRVQQVTQFPVRWEALDGTFAEVKGQLPTSGT